MRTISLTHLPTPIFFATILVLSLAFGVENAHGSVVKMDISFIWQIPDGAWKVPWSGACEEASIAMTEQWYTKKITSAFVPKELSKKLMLPMFEWENKAFGSNIDTSAERTARIINESRPFRATIQTYPSLTQIKNELRNNRPVISLHYGRALNNPNHRFRRGGSAYHAMVLVGYDDIKREFIVHDPELKKGRELRYKYETIMGSLRDFDHKTRKTGGAPVALFTAPTHTKTALVKTADVE